MADLFRLDGKVAVVTGGGQGIGEAICRRLAAAGAKVGVFDMNADAAKRVAAAVGGVPMVGDLTKEADLARVFGEVVKAAGPVDILVNNAGVASRKGRDVPIWESVREDWEFVFGINVTGYTARMTIKDRVGGTVLETLVIAAAGATGIVIDTANFTTTLTITATDTALLTFGKAVYDLEMVSPTGVVTAILAGAVTLSKEVTT